MEAWWRPRQLVRMLATGLLAVSLCGCGATRLDAARAVSLTDAAFATLPAALSDAKASGLVSSRDEQRILAYARLAWLAQQTLRSATEAQDLSPTPQGEATIASLQRQLASLQKQLDAAKNAAGLKVE